MGSLTDGTTYPANIVLDVESQNMTIAITNSGYKKTAPLRRWDSSYNRSSDKRNKV